MLLWFGCWPESRIQARPPQPELEQGRPGKAVTGKEAAAPPVGRDAGMCGDVCDLDKVHLFSVFRQDYRVVLFLPCPILATEWPCLVLGDLGNYLCSTEGCLAGSQMAGAALLSQASLLAKSRQGQARGCESMNIHIFTIAKILLIRSLFQECRL